MPLRDNSRFGVKAMTEAINRLPASPTQLREMKLFKPRFLTTTYVNVENKNGKLTLVQTAPRGTLGVSGDTGQRQIRTFNIPHLPRHDSVLADEVQNIRAFGSDQAATVESVVNDKLASMKADIEMTREHMMIGALNGKILDADGTELYDVYNEFGMTRHEENLAFATKTTEVTLKLDQAMRYIRTQAAGEMITGYVALCSPEFIDSLKYHPTMKELYVRYRDGSLYRENSSVVFAHNGIKFIEYAGNFGVGKSGIKTGEAILLPEGTRNTFAEYFAPGDFNEAVNTIARPYYASREKLTHGMGWDLYAQSNPLPLVLRPELVVTLKSA